MYKDGNVKIYSKNRFIVVIIFELMNFGIICFGLATTFKDKSTFFLMIFVMNFMLYFSYYCTMKAIKKERISKIAYCLAFCILACMFPGGYLFLTKEKNTGITPSLSRNLNKECVFSIFSGHDLWHLLSSAGLFFLFLFLLVIDDGIYHWSHEDIYVF